MIHFELVTLNGKKFGGNVHEVVLPTPQGQIAIFPHHMPLVSIVSPGMIKVRERPDDPDDFMKVYATNGGVIEIAYNQIRVLVDEADSSDEINEQEARKAHQEALDLRKNARDLVSLDQAQGLIDRTSTRLKVAELRRHRRSR